MGPDPGAAASPPPSGGTSAATPVSWELSEWPVFVIPGVVKLGELSGAGVVFGAGVSEGYGDVTTNMPGDPSGSISVVQPYLGFYDAGERHRLMLEYSPTIDLYNQNKFDGGVLERGGIRGFNEITKRLRWVFAAYATSGSEYLRELSGLGMGEYPGWLTFTVPSQNVFASTATTGLHYRSRPHQEFAFTIGDTYSSVHDGPHYDAGLVRAQMTNYFGRESNWYLFTQANRYSNQPDCTRIEPGFGFVLHQSATTTFAVEGATAYGAGTCTVHLTGDFAGAFVQRIAPKVYLYLTAARDLIEPYLLQSKWTDEYTAKFGFDTSRTTSFLVGTAYARASDLPDTDLSRYRGFQAFSDFDWRLSESVRLVASYRYFKRDFNLATAVDPSIEDKNSWIFLSLVWHPVSRSMRRAN